MLLKLAFYKYRPCCKGPASVSQVLGVSPAEWRSQLALGVLKRCCPVPLPAASSPAGLLLRCAHTTMIATDNTEHAPPLTPGLHYF